MRRPARIRAAERKFPFASDDPKGFNFPIDIRTRDLWHLFYQEQMQNLDLALSHHAL